MLLVTFYTSFFSIFSQIKIRYSIKYSDALSVRLFYTVPSVIIYEFLLIIRVLPIFVGSHPCYINKRSRNLSAQSLVPASHYTAWVSPYATNTMITLFVEDYNPLTPDFYNYFLSKLQLHQLSCPCGHAGCLHIHGYYKRFIKTPSGKLPFRILRVKCECCGHTHAILLSSMVPYSQISLSDQLKIIQAADVADLSSVMVSNPSIEESNCRFILRNFRTCWHQKILSEHIPLNPLKNLITSCFRCFSQQFMQIKRTTNILFLNTT